eukprot:TRINITY_DN14790_c0_g1_i1.p1 TRINITY_DN14790_c0_g1~~TRINITY_DN14790_c0_g1_i1.p1  ORF type:complete len:482 (-),score=70.23 TRINITY_DN14790_c0_g1_i1:264-1709(-)
MPRPIRFTDGQSEAPSSSGTQRPEGCSEAPTSSRTQRPEGHGESPTSSRTQRPEAQSEAPTSSRTLRPEDNVFDPGTPTTAPPKPFWRQASKPAGVPRIQLAEVASQLQRSPPASKERCLVSGISQREDIGRDPSHTSFADDDTDTEDESMPLPDGTCYRLKAIGIEHLMPDGTLGLLLHGTTVVGFREKLASEAGWRIGDQIVDVDGRRTATFDDFLSSFSEAQELGLPVTIRVLRREAPVHGSNWDSGGLSLQRFLEQASSLRAAGGGLSSSRGRQEESDPQLDADAAASAKPWRSQVKNVITSNPYIQALKERRTELHRSSTDWPSGENLSSSLASRLATQRSGLATLTSTPEPSSGSSFTESTTSFLRDIAPRWLNLGTCDSNVDCQPHGCSAEFRPTPRVDRFDMLQEEDALPSLSVAASRVLHWQSPHQSRHSSLHNDNAAALLGALEEIRPGKPEAAESIASSDWVGDSKMSAL